VGYVHYTISHVLYVVALFGMFPSDNGFESLIMSTYKKPSKFAVAGQVIMAVIAGLVIAAMAAIPILIELDYKLSLINFLNRH
jgi:hypothetical protein